MIIEDIYGNIITNPNLQKGKLEKTQRDGEPIYIYFPFSEDEQQAYNFNNEANITQDKCQCEIYKSTKATISYSDTDPFCYAYAREVDRGNKTIAQCPSELQARIQELIHFSTITFAGKDVMYKEDGTEVTELARPTGYVSTINVSSSATITSITDNNGKSYTQDAQGNIRVSFSGDITIATETA